MSIEDSSVHWKGFTIWLTGLPSAGKSSIAEKLEQLLVADGHSVALLDGDEIRQRLSKGLGFSKADRDENIRRISYVARLLTKAGSIAVVAAISPYRSVREEARAEIKRFVEVHVDCPVEECIKRDVKGLYKKALSGQLKQFTGISDPYEPPAKPEVVVRTDRESVEESVSTILSVLGRLNYVPVRLSDRQSSGGSGSAGAREAAGATGLSS